MLEGTESLLRRWLAVYFTVAYSRGPAVYLRSLERSGDDPRAEIREQLDRWCGIYGVAPDRGRALLKEVYPELWEAAGYAEEEGADG